MDGSRDCHTDWTKSKRKTQMSYDITFMWHLKKLWRWTYLQKTNRVTNIENTRLSGSKGETDKLGYWDQHTHTITYKMDN